jgi:predicted ATPase/class 3 adenylate cyclase/uncharacterized protein HemY
LQRGLAITTLPTGTVTFLFTDIEGSTKLLQQLGSEYARALGEHQALLREVFAAYGGVEVDTQGDAFFVAFATAPAATQSAAEATRALAAHAWPAGTTLRVRMGLHTGTPQLVGDHYVGLDVHRAARIAAAGHGGQVLLSPTARELVVHALPEGTTLRDLGAHRLKDLQHPEQLFQLMLPGLPADFPPLKTLDTHQHNLPVQPTPLLDRVEQLPALTALLRRADVRLVTLTGPGGIGKTRLALQVAAELVDAFADGVWFTRLSRLVDPTLVVPTIAQTLGLKETGSHPLADLLQAYVADRRLLLVLDNFEQVVGAAPELAALLGSSPGLRLLVTSRVSLHLRGEHEYPLAPLPLPPDLHHLPTPEQLSQYAAVALFFERAQAVRPDFTVTAANAPAIADICVRLDGLPLAIELAASRVRVLSPEALLARLSSQLKVLTGGARDLEERQQTMRAAIAWSEQLLLPAEQGLLRRLAVFVGGCTLGAAEAVCVPPEGGEPLELDVLDGLSTLVDHSLVQQREEGGESRFGLLHVIREYALERLAEHGEAEALMRAHAHYCRALVEQAGPELTGSRAHAWTSRLDQDYDNLRAALEWAHAHDELALVADLAHGLRHYWLRRALFREGVHYLGWGVAASEGEQSARPEQPGVRQQRAELDLAHGQLLLHRGQPEVSVTALQRALSAFRERHDRRGEAAALAAVGEAGRYTGQYEAAVDSLEQSLAITREVGDRQGEGVALSRLGQVALRRGQLEAAEGYLEQALIILREVGDRLSEEEVLSALGQAALGRGQLETAAGYLEQSLAMARESGDRQGVGEALAELGQVALRRGQLAAAAGYLQQSLAIAREVGERRGEGVALSRLGQAALGRGQLETAADALQQSLAIAREVGDRRWEARSLCALGRVAEARDDLARAETMYQGSLAIATDRGLGQELAEAQLALGCLLAERLDRRDEGCPLLLEAARRYREMGMPEAQEARAAVERNGCVAAEEAIAEELGDAGPPG